MKQTLLFITLIGIIVGFRWPDKTIKIAVVDTGLDLSDTRIKLCKYGHKDYSGAGIRDTNGHGTHIAGLIQKYAGEGNYCLIIIKFFNENSDGNTNTLNEVNSIRWAIKVGATIINLSGGGMEYNTEEATLLKNNPNVLLIGAAGNEGKEMRWYPCGYNLPNSRCVGAIYPDGSIAAYSNYGYTVKYYETGLPVKSYLPDGKEGMMYGTSQATAIHTGKFIRELLKTSTKGSI